MRYLVVLNQVNRIIAQKEDNNIYEKEWRKKNLTTKPQRCLILKQLYANEIQ